MLKTLIKILCGDYLQVNIKQGGFNHNLFKPVIVILLSSIAWCIGLYIKDVNEANIFLMIIALTILGWGFWAFSIWFLGNRFLNIYQSYRAILGILAFSYVPSILMVFIGFSIINTNIIWIISRIWILVISIFIFRNFLNISLRRSFFLVFFGWLFTQIIYGKFY